MSRLGPVLKKQFSMGPFYLVLGCFFISGTAGLVYQIVWSRYLALLLGHTSYAVVAVLVAFMGGLAIGNAWFGRIADRTNRPLALYGFLEIAITAYALLFPSYFAVCQDAFGELARRLQLGPTGMFPLKFIFSILTISVPTILMGGTFPTLTRFATRSLTELRQRVGLLYAINSAGAVAGCFVAAFWWIPQYGLERTVLGGAVLNLLAGIVALLCSRRLGEANNATSPPPSNARDLEHEPITPRQLRFALVGIGVSGFVAMLLEVAWTRLLALALGSSTHAFSIMLITFITGITAGSWFISVRRNIHNTMRAFGWAEIALAASLLISMFWYDRLPFWFVTSANVVARRPDTFPLYELLQMAICFAAMFIPTVCLGMTLPLVSRIATHTLSSTGRSVGTVFAVNTVGTVVGALFTGLWIMPSLGLAKTFGLGVALSAAVGVLMLNANPTRLFVRRVAVILPIGIAGIMLVAVKLDPVWQRIFTLGLWRFTKIPETFAEFRALALAENMTFYKDGASSTVSVYSWEEQGTEHLSLKVNGKTDANSKANVPTQLLLGHIPMLLHPEAQRALVIGLGSGMTCSAVARHSSIQRIDAIEISPEVVQAARMFGAHNQGILDDSRMHVTIEDAKSFLQVTPETYDVIISEPSNPWVAGVAGVFSLECYEHSRNRLSPNGLMVQWVHLDDINDEAINIVLATFTSVFPYTSVWHGLRKDLILVGSVQPIRVDLDALSARFHDPVVRADLDRFGLHSVPVFLGCELISQSNSIFVPGDQTPIHSDFHPVLEFTAQKAFFTRATAQAWQAFDETTSPRPTTWLARYFENHSLNEHDFQAFAAFYAGYQLMPPALLRSLALRWQRERPHDTLPLEITTLLSDPLPPSEGRVLSLAPFADRLIELAEQDPALLRAYAKYLMEAYRSQRSVYFIPPTAAIETVLHKLLATDPPNKRCFHLYLAELAWDRGDDGGCLRFGQDAFDPDTARSGPIQFSLDPDAPEIVLARMIETFLRKRSFEQAWELAEQARHGGYIDLDRTDSLLAMAHRKAAFAISARPRR
jgi:spermidine synthase